jgi:DNA-binding GntR family transcriptional regulator
MQTKVPRMKNIEPPASLKAKAFQRIKAAIINGELEPGKLYSEPNMARVLGISRTPVHEAVLDLVSRGFVTLVPRRGFRILELTEHDVRHLYSFRIILETAVVREIASIVTDVVLQNAEDILVRQNKMLEKKDWFGFLEMDRQFHSYLSGLTNNQYIISALENVRDLIDWVGFQSLVVREKRMKEAVVEHLKIVEHLKSNNVEAAALQMENHLRAIEKVLYKKD